MNVLIACQAGSGVGLGHLSRSLVIGEALQTKLGARVRYLIQSEPIQRHELDVFPHEFLPPEADISSALAAIDPVDLILLDLQFQHLLPNILYTIKQQRANGTKVVAIDGLIEHHVDLDLVFVPSCQLGSVDKLAPESPVVFGWDCYLLDEKQTKGNWCPGDHVLVLTGGSDAAQLGLTWPSLLDQALSPRAVLDWVVGPFAMRPILPKQQRLEINQHIAPEGLGTLMSQANYAVTVFGVSFFELLFLGVPTVVFSPYGNKDLLILREIEAAGVGLVATDEKDAAKKLNRIMEDEVLARRLSDRAKALVSVSGTVRLCSEISKICIDRV